MIMARREFAFLLLSLIVLAICELPKHPRILRKKAVDLQVLWLQSWRRCYLVHKEVSATFSSVLFAFGFWYQHFLCTIVLLHYLIVVNDQLKPLMHVLVTVLYLRMVDPVNYLKFKYVWITNKDDRMQKNDFVKRKVSQRARRILFHTDECKRYLIERKYVR